MAQRSRIAAYLQKYHEVLYGEAWYGAHLFKILDTIPYSLAFQRPKEELKSIAELLWHMLAWRKYIIQKLEGNAAFRIELNTGADWPDSLEHSPETWQQLLADFKENHIQLEALLNKEDDALFSKIVPGIDYTFEFVLEGIIQHDIYHFGQIVLLEKLLRE